MLTVGIDAPVPRRIVDLKQLALTHFGVGARDAADAA
jgi:hypothetical protein